MRTIQLKSSDKEIFEVTETIAKQSKVILNLLELGEFSTSKNDEIEILIPLPNVRGKLLRMVIQWIEKHVDEQLTEKELQDWESQFVDLDMELMYELIMAANYLEVSGLLHRACQRIADLIHGKKPEEIREMFNIENDFSPEEEEELRRQNGWVFESPSTSGTK